MVFLKSLFFIFFINSVTAAEIPQELPTLSSYLEEVRAPLKNRVITLETGSTLKEYKKGRIEVYETPEKKVLEISVGYEEDQAAKTSIEWVEYLLTNQKSLYEEKITTTYSDSAFIKPNLKSKVFLKSSGSSFVLSKNQLKKVIEIKVGKATALRAIVTRKNDSIFQDVYFGETLAFQIEDRRSENGKIVERIYHSASKSFQIYFSDFNSRMNVNNSSLAHETYKVLSESKDQWILDQIRYYKDEALLYTQNNFLQYFQNNFYSFYSTDTMTPLFESISNNIPKYEDTSNLAQNNQFYKDIEQLIRLVEDSRANSTLLNTVLVKLISILENIQNRKIVVDDRR